MVSEKINIWFEKGLMDEFITELAQEPQLSDETLLEIGKVLFERPVSEIVAEGRE